MLVGLALITFVLAVPSQRLYALGQNASASSSQSGLTTNPTPNQRQVLTTRTAPVGAAESDNANSASNAKDRSAVSVNASIGYTDFRDRNGAGFEDSFNYGLGIGYTFNRWIAVEFNNNSTKSFGNQDSDVYQWHLDAILPFSENASFSPYFTVGIGQASYDLADGSKNSEKQYNAGLGAKWKIFDDINMRAEFRGFEGLDTDDVNSTFSIGFFHDFQISNSADRDRPELTSAPEAPIAVISSVQQQLAAKLYQPPAPVPVAPVSFAVTINFDHGSVELPPHEASDLAAISEFAKRHREVTIVLEGHTDASGSISYNERLALQRARAVQRKLQQKYSLNSIRIVVKSRGELSPLVPNDPVSGRQPKNRRVEVKITAVR